MKGRIEKPEHLTAWLNEERIPFQLSLKEADALIELLLQAENPYTCPHGRPTIIAMSKYELEKKFKRIQ